MCTQNSEAKQKEEGSIEKRGSQKGAAMQRKGKEDSYDD